MQGVLTLGLDFNPNWTKANLHNIVFNIFNTILMKALYHCGPSIQHFQHNIKLNILKHII
jgi:hypothetical protein